MLAGPFSVCQRGPGNAFPPSPIPLHHEQQCRAVDATRHHPVKRCTSALDRHNPSRTLSLHIPPRSHPQLILTAETTLEHVARTRAGTEGVRHGVGSGVRRVNRSLRAATRAQVRRRVDRRCRWMGRWKQGCQSRRCWSSMLSLCLIPLSSSYSCSCSLYRCSPFGCWRTKGLSRAEVERRAGRQGEGGARLCRR